MQAYKTAVIGAGSFGSVLANILARNGHQVCLYLRSRDHYKEIISTGKNQRYFEDFLFNEDIKFTTDLSEALYKTNFVFVAVPSKSFRSLLPDMQQHLMNDVCIISTAKGIEPESFLLMTEIVKQELPNVRVGALSGPNLAMEISKDELTGSVIASSDEKLNKDVQSLLSCQYFRVYDNKDIYGVELAGALKNIYAIAAGMAHALGAGQNAKSMLLTRSLAEMSRFAVHLGANPMTFLGLAGVGDLFVTCTSPLSRNFQLGYSIASGKKPEQAIVDIGSTVEGYTTVKTVYKEALKRDIYMPLTSALYKILYEDEQIAALVKGLMLGESNHDVEFSGAYK